MLINFLHTKSFECVTYLNFVKNLLKKQILRLKNLREVFTRQTGDRNNQAAFHISSAAASAIRLRRTGNRISNWKRVVVADGSDKKQCIIVK